MNLTFDGSIELCNNMWRKIAETGFDRTLALISLRHHTPLVNQSPCCDYAISIAEKEMDKKDVVYPFFLQKCKKYCPKVWPGGYCTTLYISDDIEKYPYMHWARASDINERKKAAKIIANLPARRKQDFDR